VVVIVLRCGIAVVDVADGVGVINFEIASHTACTALLTNEIWHAAIHAQLHEVDDFGVIDVFKAADAVENGWVAVGVQTLACQTRQSCFATLILIRVCHLHHASIAKSWVGELVFLH